MKILVVSDLHLEFSDVTIENPGADVLILSGDIMLACALRDYPEGCEPNISPYYQRSLLYRAFLKRCSDAFKHVLYVAGNHEFYHGRFHAELETLRTECAKFPNMTFMEKDQLVIDGIRFVGTTLWTDCNKENALTTWSLPRRMNDYRIITWDGAGYRRLRPEDTIKLHKDSLNFIDEAVAASSEPVVVVSHHAPTPLSIHWMYEKDYEMNGAFASDLTQFILDRPKIKLWTHGHTHHFFDYKIGKTRVVCNPRGYHNGYAAEPTDWQPDLLIEVTGDKNV